MYFASPDVGVDDEVKTTTCTSEHATAHEEFATPSKKRPQQNMTAWGKTKLSSLFREDNGLLHYFSDVLFARFSCVLFVFSCIFLAYPHLSKAGTVGEDNFLSRIIFIGVHTRCVNCCTRTGARIVISICVNAGYTPYSVVRCLLCPPRAIYCSSMLIAFRLR